MKCPKCNTEMKEKNTFVITDYKNFGSFKVAKCLGLIHEEEPLLSLDGSPILLKSGKNKGKPKTTPVIRCDSDKADLKFEALQVNRYRIFFENNHFPISKMRLQVMVRDGGLYVAKARGIIKNLYLIPIPRMDDTEVLYFYNQLQEAVDEAFAIGWAPHCSAEESWNGRRCDGFCEVSEACQLMDEQPMLKLAN